MVIGRRKLLRNCSKSTSVLQFREENVARILLATSALLSTDSFIWLFHDKFFSLGRDYYIVVTETFPTIASVSGPVKKNPVVLFSA